MAQQRASLAAIGPADIDQKLGQVTRGRPQSTCRQFGHYSPSAGELAAISMMPGCCTARQLRWQRLNKPAIRHSERTKYQFLGRGVERALCHVFDDSLHDFEATARIEEARTRNIFDAHRWR